MNVWWITNCNYSNKIIFAFVENIWDAEKSKVNIDLEDEIVKGTLLTKAGKLLLK